MIGGTVRFGYNSNIVILDEDVTTNKLITITVQMDASIGTKVYVNENLVGEIKNEETAIAPSEIFWIGKSLDYTDRYFEGQINHFMIYDRLLTEEEIAYNYRIDEKRYNTVNETDYVTEGLIAHYDVINNTGNGYSNTTTTWKDLSGNGNDATLIGFDSTSGWQENYIKFDGIDDYALSINNLGLSGDTALTMCAVAEWDTDN